MKETRVNTNDIDWQPAEEYPAGAMKKVLHDGSDSNPRAILLKIEPGWLMETHAHTGSELHFILEGQYESCNEVYSAGSFRMIPAHTEHGPFTTINGAVVLVVWLKDLR